MIEGDQLQFDDEAERELRMFVGTSINETAREVGNTHSQLGDGIMDGSVGADDLIAAHSKPVGFLEEHHVLLEAFCDDLDGDAAELLRHAASIHNWCVATARRIQRGDDPQHYAEGAQNAMEHTAEALDDLK